MDIQGFRVLIVDDNPDVRKLVRLYLEQNYYQVEEASSGEEAIKYFEESKVQFDLILMDYIMGGIDGFNASQLIWDIQPNFPIIMLTAYSNVSLATRFLQQGGSGLIEKPVDIKSKQLDLSIKEALNYKIAKDGFLKNRFSCEEDDQLLSDIFNNATTKPSFQFPDPHLSNPWKILIVDDDMQVHQTTEIVLLDFNYNGCELDILSAFSAKEAIEIIEKHPDIAVVLLDITMETKWSGFDVVSHVRKKIGNKITRIIVRTNTAGDFPAVSVANDHEIDGFLPKDTMNPMELTIGLTTALRTYRQLAILTYDKLKLIRRNKELIKQQTSQDSKSTQ